MFDCEGRGGMVSDAPEERSLWERDGGWEIGGERAYLHTGSPF